MKIKNIQKTLFILVFTLCVIAMIFAPEILMIFATKDYAPAIDAMPAIVISTFFIFVYNHFCYIEMYFEKNMFIMIASIITALLNIILNSIFIPTFGFIAAGYTTLASYIVFCFLHYFMYKKILLANSLKELYNIKVLCIISIVALIVTFFMQLIYDYALLRYSIILAILFISIMFRNSIIAFIKNVYNE